MDPLPVPNLVHQFLNINNASLNNLYSIWFNHYHNPHPLPINPNGYGIHSFISTLHAIPTILGIPLEAYEIGIDIPASINWYKCEKRVMVIGKNPNRTIANWNLSPHGMNNHNSILLNSAWGCHNHFLFNSQYHNFFQTLLQKNLGLYLTDLYKVFYKINNIVGLPSFHQSISTLANEINLYKPQAIVTIGNDAIDALPGNLRNGLQLLNNSLFHTNYSGIPVLALPHLSARIRANQINNYFNINQVNYNFGTRGAGFANLVLQNV